MFKMIPLFGSFARLNTYQNAHASLLLEFEFYLRKDSKIINECILNRQFCFIRHDNFSCARNCYLTSKNDFSINFQTLEYKKIKVNHITCLHERNGLVHQMSHLTIGTDFSVPDSCLTLTSNNNMKCGAYFHTGPTYILQCRDGEVFATGNLRSYVKLVQTIFYTKGNFEYSFPYPNRW